MTLIDYKIGQYGNTDEVLTYAYEEADVARSESELAKKPYATVPSAPVVRRPRAVPTAGLRPEVTLNMFLSFSLFLKLRHLFYIFSVYE